MRCRRIALAIDVSLRGPCETALQTFCAPDVTVAIEHLDPPHHADHGLLEVKQLRRAAQNQGYPAEFIYKHGSGDAGFYSARGVAAIAFGVDGAGQHGPNEYVEIGTIVPYYRALKEFLERLSPAADG